MGESSSQKHYELLLVEDNPGDVTLVKEGLKGLGSDLTLHVQTDGRDALRFLEAAQPRPDLIILDLNVPGITGHEILQYVKSHPQLRRIPVVIFSSSGAARDVAKAYELCANGYVEKPVDLDEFFAAVAEIEHFWVRTASLPAH